MIWIERIGRLQFALPILLIGTCVSATAQDNGCGAGKDLVVQALERITPRSSNDAFEDALQLLKHAVSECPELAMRGTTEALWRNASATNPWPNTQSTRPASTTLKLCNRV